MKVLILTTFLSLQASILYLFPCHLYLFIIRLFVKFWNFFNYYSFNKPMNNKISEKNMTGFSALYPLILIHRGKMIWIMLMMFKGDFTRKKLEFEQNNGILTHFFDQTFYRYSNACSLLIICVSLNVLCRYFQASHFSSINFQKR